MLRVLVSCLPVLLLAGGTGTASACSVPVFRYALERWPADNYRLVVFHQGALTPPQTAWLRDLERSGPAGKMSANLALQTVDLAATTDPELLRWWQPLASTTTLPAMVLLYPPGLGLSTPAWHGPLTGDNVRQLLDSPLRREIAGRLLKGDCAVWALVESGDQKMDTAAARMLEARLRHLETTLKLPDVDPDDVRGGATAASEKLRVVFSMVRVSRQNPAEDVLVRMLLNTEEDLEAAREPIVFPVFGQGRALYALVGQGINPEMIDEASGFLTGACSCIVKEQNPGRDLLLAVDWARLVEPLIKGDEELPPLPGIAEFASDPSAGRAPHQAVVGARAPAVPANPDRVPPPGAASPESRRVTNPLIPGLLLVGGLVGGVLLGVTGWWLRHRE